MRYWRIDIEYNILITNEARTMLDKHFIFLGRVSINAKIKLKKNIREYLIILKYFPKIGQKIYSDSEIKLRKLTISKRYVLIYYILKNKIYIKTVLDTRQNNNYYLI